MTSKMIVKHCDIWNVSYLSIQVFSDILYDSQKQFSDLYQLLWIKYWSSIKNTKTQFGYKVCSISTVSAPIATKCIFIVQIHFSMHYFSTLLYINNDEKIKNTRNGFFSRVYLAFSESKANIHTYIQISHFFWWHYLF